MTDVYVENIEQTLQEALDIYKPSPAIRQGEYDGEEFTIEVRERELPTGTPPSIAQNINLIEWDKAFYLEWGLGGGNVTSYDIVVRNSNDNIVSEILGRTELFVKFEDLPGTFPQNGEEYSFVITSNFLSGRLSASEVLGTGSNKTPQNLVVISGLSGKIKLSWDDLGSNFNFYRLYVRTSGNVIRVVDDISQSEYELRNLERNISYDITVVSVSEKDIFESSESNKVSSTISYVPQNFVADNYFHKPDTPQNFSVEILPDPPQNLNVNVIY